MAAACHATPCGHDTQRLRGKRKTMKQNKIISRNGLTVILLMTISIVMLFPSVPTRGFAEDAKIGFLLKTMQEQRYRTDKNLFITRAESLGARVVFNSSANDERLQLDQFEKMLDDGCRIIVLQPSNTGTAGYLVQLAHRRGVRVVGYDSMLQNGPLDVMVMQDSWMVGKIQGKMMLEWMRKKKGAVKGNVALITGQPGDANAHAMSSGVLETIRDNPGLKLIARRSHVNWRPILARQTADALLVRHNNDIDAFICNNSGLARGVISALEAEGLADADRVFVAGADADLANIRYVTQGKQALEIWKKIKPLAYRAAEIAVMLARDPEKAEALIKSEARMISNGHMDVPTIITPIVAITKDTVDTSVIEGGFYTREEVYGK